MLKSTARSDHVYLCVLCGPACNSILLCFPTSLKRENGFTFPDHFFKGCLVLFIVEVSDDTSTFYVSRKLTVAFQSHAHSDSFRFLQI